MQMIVTFTKSTVEAGALPRKLSGLSGKIYVTEAEKLVEA